MAFTQKTWENRQVEFTNRRKLTFVEGTGTDWKNAVFDVERYEGDVSVEGDLISAANLNNLEERIAKGFTDLENSVSSTQCKNIIVCTQDEYDALANPDSTTLYLIKG